MERFGDFVQTKPTDKCVNTARIDEEIHSISSAMPPSNFKFEEAEMPSLDHLEASSDGMFHCPYQDCRPRKAFDKIHSLR